jgi:hypothetical protein
MSADEAPAARYDDYVIHDFAPIETEPYRPKPGT